MRNRTPRAAMCGPVRFVVCALISVAVIAPTAAHAATDSWWLNLRTAGYAYQSFDASGAEIDHLEGYQSLSGAVNGLAGGRVDLRMSARLADDVQWDGETLLGSRLHTAVLETRPIRGLTVQAGRLFIHEGSASLSLDGGRVAWKPNRRVKATVWGGARTPWDHGLDMNDFDLDRAMGARLETRTRSGLRLGLSTACRKRDGEVAERPLGLDCAYTARNGLALTGRGDYDLELEDWRRMEARIRLRAEGRRPELRVQLLSRRPRVDAASWFSRFASAERIRLARVTLRRERPEGVGGELEYLGTFVDDRTSSRVGMAALLPLGRIGWSIRVGDAGEENGFYGDLGGRLNGWLRADVSASLLDYTLLNDDPDDGRRTITTLAARLRADVRPGMELTAEVQRFATPHREKDVRLLVGMNLAAGGGPSRFGLTRGEVRP